MSDSDDLCDDMIDTSLVVGFAKVWSIRRVQSLALVICLQIKLKLHNQVTFAGFVSDVLDTTEPKIDTSKRSEKRQTNLDVSEQSRFERRLPNH